eukprot:2579754-Pleurochrysis_carterae.AAC.1
MGPRPGARADGRARRPPQERHRLRLKQQRSRARSNPQRAAIASRLDRLPALRLPSARFAPLHRHRRRSARRLTCRAAAGEDQ